MINLGQTILDIIPTSELEKDPNLEGAVIAKLEAQGHREISTIEIAAVRTSKTYDPTNSSSNNFYEQVSGDWLVEINRVREIPYAFIVYKDVVLEIYEVAHWTEKVKDERCVFRGQPILRPIICKDANGSNAEVIYPGHPLSVYISKKFSSSLDKNSSTGEPQEKLGIIMNPVRYYTIFFK